MNNIQRGHATCYICEVQALAPNSVIRHGQGWRSAFLGNPGAKFLCGKPRIGTKNPTHEKLTKLREHLSKSR
jgi:hypothetical protein